VNVFSNTYFQKQVDLTPAYKILFINNIYTLSAKFRLTTHKAFDNNI